MHALWQPQKNMLEEVVVIIPGGQPHNLQQINSVLLHLLLQMDALPAKRHSDLDHRAKPIPIYKAVLCFDLM
jgi:hypothetical protein